MNGLRFYQVKFKKMNLLSPSDLSKRWGYSRAGISKLMKSESFPEPIGTVNNGRTKIYEEESIKRYEKNKPWLFDEEQKRRRQNLYCSLSHAKRQGAEDKNKILQRLFSGNAKNWENKA